MLGRAISERRRRAKAKDPAKFDEQDALLSGYLAAIEGKAEAEPRTRTRMRAKKPTPPAGKSYKGAFIEFPPEAVGLADGGIPAEAPAEAGGTALCGSAAREVSAGVAQVDTAQTSPDWNDPEPATRSTLSADGPDGSAAVPNTRPIRQLTARDLRPNCQHPECCAASSLNHCHSCGELAQENAA